jgi:hypothetical protein
MKFLAATLLLLPLRVFAADHAVTVGAGGAFAYNPTSVTAVAGDTVTFMFADNTVPPPPLPLFFSCLIAESLGRSG